MFYALSGVFNSGYHFSRILAIILGYIIAIVFAFGLHEYSHAKVAYKLGDPTAKALGWLTLNPLKHIDTFGIISFLIIGFGWAKPVPINPMNFRNKKRDMFLVSIAGVVTNIVLAFIFCGIYYFFVKNAGSIVDGELFFANSFLYFIYYLLVYSITINIALFIFNLLPIFPLDGFNALISAFKVSPKFINFMFRYGNIILIFIIILPIFDIIYGNVTSGISDAFINFWRLFG